MTHVVDGYDVTGQIHVPKTVSIPLQNKYFQVLLRACQVHVYIVGGSHQNFKLCLLEN